MLDVVFEIIFYSAKNEVNSIYILDISDPELIFNYISYVVDAYNVYML